MECNREDAIKSKELAENKFKARDFAAAKKFALKAQSLYPGLDDISQMVSTLDVYLSAENKINGETDLYAVLHVNPSADDETVKKQYRKLALVLHPDKNKAIGAEGAFKLISEAWGVLSDKGRRLAYDRKRNSNGFSLKVSRTPKTTSTPNVNGFTINHSKISSQKTQQDNFRVESSTFPKTATTFRQTKIVDTFWTSCNRCKMQYEYLRIYLNHNLLCPTCHEPFLAVESCVPKNRSNPAFPFSLHTLHHRKSTKNKNSNNTYLDRNSAPTIPNTGSLSSQHVQGHNSFSNSNFQWRAFSRNAGMASATASSSAAAQAADLVHRTYEKVRRERKEAQAAAKKEETFLKNNTFSKKDESFIAVNSSGTPPTNSNSIPRTERSSKKRKGIKESARISNNGEKLSIPSLSSGERGNDTYKFKELSTMETRNMLMDKARMEIGKKLKEWSEANASNAKDMNEIDSVPKKSDKSSDSRIVTLKNVVDTSHDQEPAFSIFVPDPDFHDFDKDRSEKSFKDGQVWAAYDDDDGMPRFYCLIQKVISTCPFKMRYSWLNSKTNNELGSLNWIGSGFTKTCGEFRIGKYEVRDTVNCFSHQVNWEKGLRGIIRIFPQKGETWALYRNWSPKWNENTPDEVVQKYDIVEILDDYSDEQGVSIIPLVKMAGFQTVFHRHMKPEEVRQIPREEMFRFSHPVPSWLLTGEEAYNAPKGCHELDPAATPLELLQVITEAEEPKATETDK